MTEKSVEKPNSTITYNTDRSNDSKEVHLLDILSVLARRKKSIIIATVASVVVVIAISFFMRYTYTTSLTLLPPEKSQTNPLAALLGGTTGLTSTFDLGDVGENHSSDFYVDMLKSRTLAESLLVDFPEIRRYFANNGVFGSQQIASLQECLTLEVERDGLVKATVETTTGNMPSQAEQQISAHSAADIANAYAKELDKLSQLKVISRAHNSRIFIESQLQATNTQLDSLYNEMTAFQKQYKIVALDKQVESEIGTAVDLKSQINELELRRAYLLHVQSPASMEVKQIETHLSELQDQYNKMSFGGDTSDYYIPFPKVPELQKQYANMVRDLKVLEQVDAYLQNQYYQERVQEERDTPIVQVLDSAPVPEQRSSPRRAMMAIMTCIVGLLLACIWMFIVEYFRAIPNIPGERERMRRLMGYIAPRSRYARLLANESGMSNGNGARYTEKIKHEHETTPHS